MKILKIVFFIHVVLVAIAVYALFNLRGGYNIDKATIKRLKYDSITVKRLRKDSTELNNGISLGEEAD